MLEMLLVLFIISTVLFLSSFDFGVLQKSRLNNEINNFIFNYYNTRIKSFTNENCRVTLYSNSYEYGCDNFKRITTLSNISNNFKNNNISFNEKGNISQAGTISFKLDDFNRVISISIMSGSINEK